MATKKRSSTPKPTTPEKIQETSPDKADALKAQADAAKQAAGNQPAIEGIAVLGSNPKTIMMAPFDDPKWVIYGCSSHNLATLPPVDYEKNAFVKRPDPRSGQDPYLRYLQGGRRPDGGAFRVDQWFEVHSPFCDETRPLSYVMDLATNPKHQVVWVRDPEAVQLIQSARLYPEKELTERFGPFFWTSSIAYMLAKALIDCEANGIKQVGIWGVMQAHENEYSYQRPGIQYWITRLNEAGITVVCNEESKLFEPQKVKW